VCYFVLPAACTDSSSQQQQQQQQQQPNQQEVSLSAGLSRALCYVNRHAVRYGASARHKAKPRLLALMSSSDLPLQYIPTMNAIFAAQGSGVVLDAFVLGSSDSAFLQQASHLTGGLYMRASEPAGMLEYLLGAFSADTATREAMSVTCSSQIVDYRASCFCHKQIIDTGYICSVCLSIFCKANMKATKCLTCGAPFKQKEGGKAAAAPSAAAGGS
jgi:transcription initiation factor TFIIH subunit 3